MTGKENLNVDLKFDIIYIMSLIFLRGIIITSPADGASEFLHFKTWRDLLIKTNFLRQDYGYSDPTRLLSATWLA